MIEPKCKCGHIRSKHQQMKNGDKTYWSGCWDCANRALDEFGFKNICMRWNDEAPQHIAEDIEKLVEGLRNAYKDMALPAVESDAIRSLYAAALSVEENH